jgi:tetratricopeptide (TPR) repeat protein
LVALSLFAAGAAPAAPGSEPAGPLEEAIERGKKLAKQERYRAAAEEFQRASKLADGPCLDCLVGLANAYSELGRHSEAIATARQATQLAAPPSRLALAYNELGAALVKESERNLPEGEANFRQAIELGKDAVPVARYNLAEVLRRRGRYAESAAMARSYLGVDPRGQKAREARAVLCNVASQAGVSRPDPEPALRLAEHRDVKPPARVYLPPPNLGGAASAGLAGSKLKVGVVIEVLIDQDGCVRKAEVREGPGGNIEKAFLAAVQRAVYHPATANGRPVAVLMDAIFRVNER